MINYHKILNIDIEIKIQNILVIIYILGFIQNLNNINSK